LMLPSTARAGGRRAVGLGPSGNDAFEDIVEVGERLDGMEFRGWLFSGSGVLSGRHDGRAAKALGW